MTAVERLRQKLVECGIEFGDDSEFHRTYAGRVQRQQGAWSWFFTHARFGPVGPFRYDVGGYVPVTELARRPISVARSSADPVGSFDVDPLDA